MRQVGLKRRGEQNTQAEELLPGLNEHSNPECSVSTVKVGSNGSRAQWMTKILIKRRGKWRPKVKK
jgi:hypothetical protein